jgi:hypothetical protein
VRAQKTQWKEDILVEEMVWVTQGQEHKVQSHFKSTKEDGSDASDPGQGTHSMAGAYGCVLGTG